MTQASSELDLLAALTQVTTVSLRHTLPYSQVTTAFFSYIFGLPFQFYFQGSSCSSQLWMVGAPQALLPNPFSALCALLWGILTHSTTSATSVHHQPLTCLKPTPLFWVPGWSISICTYLSYLTLTTSISAGSKLNASSLAYLLLMYSLP